MGEPARQPTQPDDPAEEGRRARDTAMALPLLGAALLLPPVAEIFAVEGRVLGVPVVVAYVFAVWAALILLARRTARRVLETEAPPDRTGRTRH